MTTCPHCGQDAYELLRCRACGVDDLEQEMSRCVVPTKPIRHGPQPEWDLQDAMLDLSLRPVSPETVAFDRKYRRFVVAGFIFYVLALAARWLIGRLW